MANVEVHQGRQSTHEVSAGANYSHFNMFKHLERGKADAPEISTEHRQARVDSLPPPTRIEDIERTLSDTHDQAYPLFRNMTLASLLLDLDVGGVRVGHLNVWCCGSPPNGETAPAFSWDLATFFD